jgi:hypothetical protein
MSRLTKDSRAQILHLLCEGTPFARFSSSAVRIHKTLRVTPAMTAGITDKLWEIGDIVDVWERWEFEQVEAAHEPEHVKVETRFPSLRSWEDLIQAKPINPPRRLLDKCPIFRNIHQPVREGTHHEAFMARSGRGAGRRGSQPCTPAVRGTARAQNALPGAG